MNLRTKYKRLKQFVESTKPYYHEVNIDRTQLEHYRYKSNLPLFYGRDDLATDELAFREAKDRLKNEISKLIDLHTEILPDGTITLDVWFKSKDSLVTDGVVIVLANGELIPIDDIKQEIFNAIDNVPLTLSRDDADKLLKADIQNIIDEHLKKGE